MIMKKLILITALSTGILLSAAPLIKAPTPIHFDGLETSYTTEVSTFVKLITKGDYDAVKSMIVAGTDVNRKSKGMTPLMYAARYNKSEIVVLLIQHGANLKVKSDRGYTALEYAKMSKAHDTYKIISEALESRKQERKKNKRSRKA